MILSFSSRGILRWKDRMTQSIKRREFITVLGGAAAAWPLGARAQQPDRMRRIGVLMGYDENDPEAKAFLSAFTRGLAEWGWTERNVRIDVRWPAGSVDQARTFAKELVDLQPDLILANTTPVTAALQRETRTIPIVFASAADPVGDGFIASLARPGGNITGFLTMETAMSGKWLQLLREISPGVKRAAIIFNPDTAPGRGGSYYLPSFEAAARSLKVEPIVAPAHSDTEIETVMTSLRREPGGGLVVMPDPFTFVHRAPIIQLATHNNIPAVYWRSVFARDGGLLAYGSDAEDIFHRSASYVDRILRGAKPAELPVQVPTKFDMVVNVKTAKALGLAVPPSILLRADKVIE
jgi:putative tryptophan/tyrosine transport system substrate-binding protein